MKATHVLAGRLREVILDGTWIANTNFKKELTGLPVSTATATVYSLNTIAALTQHIHYYTAGILKVFKDGPLDIKDKYSFDFQPVESQQQWDMILENFFADAEELALLIEQMHEPLLDAVFVDQKYGSYRRNIDGMIEHSYYHLGQVVLIKKMLLSN